MALIADILVEEAKLVDRIILYKEGIFWKAYQYSAYRVLKRQPTFKVKKRFIKTVDCEVISLGFPDKTLKRLFLEEELKYIDEKTILIVCKGFIMSDYEFWFESVPLIDSSQKTVLQSQTSSISTEEAIVLQRLKEFSVEQSTPMDCMNFLIAIRKELNKNGNI